MKTYRQDSDDIRNYEHTWYQELARDAEITGTDVTISSSSWTVSTLTTSGATIDGKRTYVKISGGTAGTQYKVENQITTSAGLKHTKSFYILVVNK